MTDGGVEGRVVVVTGAGRGIGRGVALHLARNRASVVVAEYRADRLDAVASELAELGGPFLALTCDVGDRDGVVVNCVCPASVAHRLPPADEHRRAAFATAMVEHPMGRDVDPEDDIAPVVLFLLSDATRFMTGQSLMVDGGAMLFA